MDKTEMAVSVLRRMLPPQHADAIIAHMLAPASAAGTDAQAQPEFCSEMSRLAFENAYCQLWTRSGLSLKERSILTIGILIGLRNAEELRWHLDCGLRNGLIPSEVEEIIYHSTAYAGFPAASSARSVAAEVVAAYTEGAES